MKLAFESPERSSEAAPLRRDEISGDGAPAHSPHKREKQLNRRC
jgi:hypothetical protein